MVSEKPKKERGILSRVKLIGKNVLFALLIPVVFLAWILIASEDIDSGIE